MPIELPSVLAFERKLEVSDALMYAGDWETRNTCKWKKIPISPRYNLGTISNKGISMEDMIKPNPVAEGSNDANLFQETNTLRVSFSLRVIGDLGKPFSCNSPEFQEAISEKVKAFTSSESVTELAHRYAYNIANGRFLWRNRVGAEAIEVRVSINDKNDFVYDSYDFNLLEFTENKEQLNELSCAIEEGLKADANNCSFIEVQAYVKLGMGQHVFPSQEMNMGKDGKVLFQLEDCAAMHSVKIGNAIRTIDTWHGKTVLISVGEKKVKTVEIPEEEFSPIAIEPFGSVTQRGKAYRPSKNDLYTLIVKWLNEKEVTSEDQCYIVANLIRGGLFQKNK